MNYSEKLQKISERYPHGWKHISAMCGVTTKRLVEIVAGANASKSEQHKIDVLEKFLSFSDRGFDFTSEIDYQRKQVANLRNAVHSKLVRLGWIGSDDLDSFLDCISAESQYLGLLLANSNQDETVYEAVRKARNV